MQTCIHEKVQRHPFHLAGTYNEDSAELQYSSPSKYVYEVHISHSSQDFLIQDILKGRLSVDLYFTTNWLSYRG